MTATTTAPAVNPLAMPAPPEVARAMTQVVAMETSAAAIVIDSPVMYEAAAEELRDIRTRWKEVEAHRVHLKEPFLEGSRRIDEFFRTPLARLEALGEQLKTRMVTFRDAEDRKVREAQEAEARRQAAERAEQQRIQREAQERERQAQAQATAARELAERQAREAAEAAEAAQRQAREAAEAAQREAARKVAEAQAAGNAEAAAAAEADAQAARDRAAQEAAAAQAAAEAAQAEAQAVADAAQREAEAASLAAQQEAEAAQQAMDLADVAPVAAMVVSGAKAAGISGRETWKLKAVDKRALVIAAAKALESGDDSLLVYLLTDDKALNGIARALKGAARVPGCTFGPETTLSARSR